MWFAKGYQKMCTWKGAAALESDFVLQRGQILRLYSEEKHWNENFPYNYHYKHSLPHIPLPPPGTVGLVFKQITQNLHIWRHNNLMWEVLL